MNHAVFMAGLQVPDLVDLATEVAIHIGNVIPRIKKISAISEVHMSISRNTATNETIQKLQDFIRNHHRKG
jgi:hypothetical protein